MRKQPPPQLKERSPSLDDTEVLPIEVFETMLENGLKPGVVCTAQELGGLITVLLQFTYDKKVSRKTFNDVLARSVHGLTLLEGMKAEARMIDAMEPALAETLKTAIGLSVKEFQGIRKKLWADFELIRQCPNWGDTLH